MNPRPRGGQWGPESCPGTGILPLPTGPPTPLVPGLKLGLWSLPLAWMPRFPSSRGQQKLPKAPRVSQQARRPGSSAVPSKPGRVGEIKDPLGGLQAFFPPPTSATREAGAGPAPPTQSHHAGRRVKGVRAACPPGTWDWRRGLWLPWQTTQTRLCQAWLRQGRPRLQRPCSEEPTGKGCCRKSPKPCTQHTQGSTQEQAKGKHTCTATSFHSRFLQHLW